MGRLLAVTVFAKLNPGVMGPCFRRDDSEATPHATLSSFRKPLISLVSNCALRIAGDLAGGGILLLDGAGELGGDAADLGDGRADIADRGDRLSGGGLD